VVRDKLDFQRDFRCNAAMIADYEEEFLRFAIAEKIICFGDFTLKSGRKSPYFFNSGLFNTGAKLMKLGNYYAKTLVASGIHANVLFGPAYKGIPLVSSTSIALAAHHDMDMPYCFDRKEAKDHGEGGSLVGAELVGDVVIIDDVISAGITTSQTIELIRAAAADPVAVLIAFDRQERHVDSNMSARAEIEKNHGVKVLSISRVSSLLQYMQGKPAFEKEHEAMREYRYQYGADQFADHG